MRRSIIAEPAAGCTRQRHALGSKMGASNQLPSVRFAHFGPDCKLQQVRDTLALGVAA